MDQSKLLYQLKKKKPGNNKLATYCPTTTKYTND